MANDSSPIKPATKLHVLLASASDKAVVLRRGPSKQVATFSWNTKSNEITIGQWFKGRIHEYRSSLSPDGKHLLYSAFDSRPKSDTSGFYVAVSEAPYLKALDLYNGIESRGGGGYFVDANSYKLNEIFYKESKFLLRSGKFRCVNKPDEHCLIGGVGVYAQQLKERGWTFNLLEHWESSHRVGVYLKPISKHVQLKKLVHSQFPSPKGLGSDWEENELLFKGERTFRTLPGEWADFLNQTLYWTEKGLLKLATIDGSGKLKDERVIHDFNPYQFEKLTAPY